MQIRTLAPFAATRADGTRLLPAGKPLALLLYLAMAPGRRASRTTLAALLWDDDDERRASNNLRQALHQVRKVLPEDGLVGKPGSDQLELAVALRIDAVQFEELVAAGAHAEAWGLYQDHFLADYAAAGAAAFERWADGVRTRLREQWLRCGEALAREAAARHELDAAVAIAVRLRDDAPHRQAHWRLLFELLVAQGQLLRAVAEAEALQRLLADEDEPLERATREAIDRLQRAAPAAVAAPAAAVLAADGEADALPRRAETIGREAVFSRLLKAWQHASAGRGALVLLRAAAGLGKTRVLDDLRARLRASGAAVVSVRARPSDRALPNAVVAAMAESLAAQPGAAGVSAATAALLVDLVPTLSNVYPGVTSAAISDGGDSPALARTLALCELADAVADEAPLALLVDDLHYADAESRALLERLGDRLGGRRVLLVLAARPSGAALDVPAPTLDLAPLEVPQVEALLASIAPDLHNALPPLAAAIHAASDGVPLLVLAATELLVARGLVQLNDDGWHCADAAAAAGALQGGRVLEQVLRGVAAPAQRVLVALATAAMPVDKHRLAAVVDVPVGPLLAELAQRALVQHDGPRWELAHDRLADAALATADAAVLKDVRHRLAQRLLADTMPEAADLRLAARLLGGEDETETIRAFRRWLAATDREDYWRTPELAARTFLGDAATSALVATLAEAVPWEQRLRRGRPTLFRLLAAVALLVVAGIMGLSLAPLVQPRAMAIAIVPIPHDNGFLFDRSPGCRDRGLACQWNQMPVQATFLDARGEPTQNAPAEAVLRVLSDMGARLEGDSIAPVRKGIADFGTVRVRGGGPYRLEVAAAGIPPVRSREFIALDEQLFHHGWIRLVRGMVNGTALSPTSRTVRVAPGAELDGHVILDAITTHPSAAVLLTAIPQWGDRRTNFWPLNSLPSHGRLQKEYVFRQEWRPSWRLRAPTTPGRYRLVFVAQATTEFRFTASMTKWELGEAVWNDGNDVVDWPESLLNTLDLQGFIAEGVPVLDGWRDLDGPVPGRLNLEKPPITRPEAIAGTTITIEVTR